MSALSYSIDTMLGVVTLTFYAQPTFEEWRSVVQELLADPAYKPGTSILSDRRQLPDAKEPVATATVHRMAEFVGQAHREFRRWAVVVRPTQLGEYGMARMYGMLVERHNVLLRTFTDFDAAMTWLREKPVTRPTTR
jgi:hypothetical protein